MDDDDPADFYTDVVVDVYGPLKGSVPDPRTYAGFISRWGEPALRRIRDCTGTPVRLSRTCSRRRVGRRRRVRSRRLTRDGGRHGVRLRAPQVAVTWKPSPSR